MSRALQTNGASEFQETMADGKWQREIVCSENKALGCCTADEEAEKRGQKDETEEETEEEGEEKEEEKDSGA